MAGTDISVLTKFEANSRSSDGTNSLKILSEWTTKYCLDHLSEKFSVTPVR